MGNKSSGERKKTGKKDVILNGHCECLDDGKTMDVWNGLSGSVRMTARCGRCRQLLPVETGWRLGCGSGWGKGRKRIVGLCLCVLLCFAEE